MSSKRKVRPGMQKIFLVGGPASGKSVQIKEGDKGPFTCCTWHDRSDDYTLRILTNDDGEKVELWGHVNLSYLQVLDLYYGGPPFTFNKPARR